MSSAQPTSTFFGEQTPTSTFFLRHGPNGIDPCIDMQRFLDDESKRIEEMGDDSFFPLDRETWMHTLEEQQEFRDKYFKKYSKIFPILPNDCSRLYLGKTFLRNHLRSGCSFSKTGKSCDGFVDSKGKWHTKDCSHSHCCRGLIVKPYIECERIKLCGFDYIILKLDFDFENFSWNPADFNRRIDEYKSICKTFFVKIHDDGMIVDNSLKLMLSYLNLDESDENYRSSAEPTIGETRIFVQYDILLGDGTLKECSLGVIRLKHRRSFPDIHDVELVIPSLE